MASEPVVQPTASLSLRAIREAMDPDVRRARENAPDATPEQAVPSSSAASATPEVLEAAVAELKAYMEPHQLEPRLEVDDETRDVIVKIVEQETGELVRQIPPEEILKMRQRLQEYVGLLLDQRG